MRERNSTSGGRVEVRDSEVALYKLFNIQLNALEKGGDRRIGGNVWLGCHLIKS